MNQDPSLLKSLKHVLISIYKMSAVIAIITFIALTFGYRYNPTQFFRSYLCGYLFWIEISLGCFGLLLVSHLTGGLWGVSVRRFFEAGKSTLWLMAVLFIPILFGLKSIYLWSRPDELAHNELLQHQSIYLNQSFFILRAVLYFIVWIGFSYWTRLSALGLILYCFTASFASYDWIMSLQHDWYSTIFGMIFFVSHGLGALSFIILFLAIISKYDAISNFFTPECLNDLGNVLMVFVMLWAYLNLSQYLIIWEGNKPEEVDWYFRRSQGGWQWLAYSLALFQFAFPFFLLLFRQTKRQLFTLSGIAGLTFLIRIIDVYWSIIPSFEESLRLNWMDILAPICIGGIWISFFTWYLSKMKSPIIPVLQKEKA